MSWDIKAVAFMAVTWIVMGIIYDTAIGMVSGARAWLAGGVILFALLTLLWRADRRQTVRRTNEAAPSMTELV